MYKLTDIWNKVIEYGFNVRSFIMTHNDINKHNIIEILLDFDIDLKDLKDLKHSDKFGQEAWGFLKKYFSNYDFDMKHLGIKSTIDVKSIKYPISYNVESHDKEHEKVNLTIFNSNKLSIKLNNLIEAEHFFIQHFRILELENYKLSVVKLMQIAYNSGQFLAQSKNSPKSYNSIIANFFNEYNISNINTYILEILYGDIGNIKIKEKDRNILDGGFTLKYFKFTNKIFL